MKVVKWISLNEAENMEVAVGGMGGFFNFKEKGMRWKDYGPFKPEAEPYIEALRTEILEKHIRMTGEDHQYSPNGVPVFEDEKIGSFSYRAWGDLMAAVWSEAEDKDYSYMDFYM